MCNFLYLLNKSDLVLCDGHYLITTNKYHLPIQVQLVTSPGEAMNLLGKNGVENTSKQIMGVAEEK